MRVHLADTETVKKFIRQLKDDGCEVMEDYENALVVEAKDGDVSVYRGIQKGRNQPWLVMCRDSDNIKWSGSDST